MPRHSPYVITLRAKNDARSRSAPDSIRCHIFRCCEPASFCLPPRGAPTTRSPTPSRSDAMSSACGGNASYERLPGLDERPRSGRPEFFPPEVVVQVKALACELPATLGVPLSRLSTADIVREVQRNGIVATVSQKTVWRWLHEDAIRPWHHRTWIFPRDPDFAVKAERILDLYARQWEGRRLAPDEFVLSVDEKTSIQAAFAAIRPRRRAAGGRCGSNTSTSGVAHGVPGGTRRPPRRKLFGRCEPTTGIDPFHRLLSQVMTSLPTAMPGASSALRQRVLAPGRPPSGESRRLFLP